MECSGIHKGSSSTRHEKVCYGFSFVEISIYMGWYIASAIFRWFETIVNT